MQEAGHSVGRAAAGNSKGQGSQTLSPPHLEFVGFIFCCVERGLKKCNKMKKKSSCRGPTCDWVLEKLMVRDRELLQKAIAVF